MARQIAMSSSTFERRYGSVADAQGSTMRQYHEVKDLDLHHVWSVTEGDNGRDWYLSPGFHVVNMMGYVVSERPWTDLDFDDGLFVLW